MKKLSKELVLAKRSSHNFHFIENHLNEVSGTKMNHPSSSKWWCNDIMGPQAKTEEEKDRIMGSM